MDQVVDALTDPQVWAFVLSQLANTVSFAPPLLSRSLQDLTCVLCPSRSRPEVLAHTLTSLSR